jgi:hypothetical protein
MVIQEKDQVQLKIIKQQYRGSVKRASDMKMKVELYRVSTIYFVATEIIEILMKNIACREHICLFIVLKFSFPFLCPFLHDV